MNKGLLLGFGFLLIVAAIAIFMVMGRQKPLQTVQQVAPSALPESPSTTPTDSGGTAKVIPEIVVTGGEYSFSPSTISLTLGEETKITFKNSGAMPHNFVSDELNLSTKTIGPGLEDSITVKVEKAGTYTFYCSVGNHRQLGMEGQLLVK